MHSLRKILSLALTTSLLFQQIGFAQIATELNIAGYLSRMASSLTVEKFRPPHLRYFSYDSFTNNFKVLLDKGDQNFAEDRSQKTEDRGQKNSEGDTFQPIVNDSRKVSPTVNTTNVTKDLLNYFLIGVTLPDSMFWVNLRPDSEDQIIDQYLEKTDVGRIMLEADLQLKKDTSAMTSPATPEGREYWDRLYKKAADLYGYDNVTIPTLTRPWIVPGEIIVRESKDSAYIYKATLKVMLEQDYLQGAAIRHPESTIRHPEPRRGEGSNTIDSSPSASPQGQNDYSFKDIRSKALNEYSTQLIKELIIPKLTKEVNSAKRYASLRQVYYSLILSRWFKQRFRSQKSEDRGQKDTVIARSAKRDEAISSRIDSKNLTNLISKQPWSKTTYFQAYQKSFSVGEYNIQEPVYTPTGQVIRSYFSGGIQMDGVGSPINKRSGLVNPAQFSPERLAKLGDLLEGDATGMIKPAAGSPIYMDFVRVRIKELLPNLAAIARETEIFLNNKIGLVVSANSSGAYIHSPRDFHLKLVAIMVAISEQRNHQPWIVKIPRWATEEEIEKILTQETGLSSTAVSPEQKSPSSPIINKNMAKEEITVLIGSDMARNDGFSKGYTAESLAKAGVAKGIINPHKDYAAEQTAELIKNGITPVILIPEKNATLNGIPNYNYPSTEEIKEKFGGKFGDNFNNIKILYPREVEITSISKIKQSIAASPEQKSPSSPINNRITKEEAEAWLSSNIKLPEKVELNTGTGNHPKEVSLNKKRIQEAIHSFLMSLPRSIEPEKFEFTIELSSSWDLSITVRYGGEIKTNPWKYGFYYPFYTQANNFDSQKLVDVETKIIEEIKSYFVYRIFGRFFGEPWEHIQEFIQISWIEGVLKPDSFLVKGSRVRDREYQNNTPLVDFMELLDAWLRDGESAFSVPEAAPEETRKQAEQKLAFFELYFNRGLSGSPLQASQGEIVSSPLSIEEAKKQLRQELGKVNIVSITEDKEALINLFGRYLNSIINENGIWSYKYSHYSDRTNNLVRPHTEISFTKKGRDVTLYYRSYEYAASLGRATLMRSGTINIANVFPAASSAVGRSPFSSRQLFDLADRLAVQKSEPLGSRSVTYYLTERYDLSVMVVDRGSRSNISFHQYGSRGVLERSLRGDWGSVSAQRIIKTLAEIVEREEVEGASSAVRSTEEDTTEQTIRKLIKEKAELEDILDKSKDLTIIKATAERIQTIVSELHYLKGGDTILAMSSKENAERIKGVFEALDDIATIEQESQAFPEAILKDKMTMIRDFIPRLEEKSRFITFNLETIFAKKIPEEIKYPLGRFKDSIDRLRRDLWGNSGYWFSTNNIMLSFRLMGEERLLLSDTLKKAGLAAQDPKTTASPLEAPETLSPATTGGIDFRSLPMTIQPMGSFTGLNFKLPKLSQADLARMDIDTELAQIQRMASSGILPSGERVKELIAACIQKQKINAYTDRLLLCLVNIFKLQELDAVDSSPALREALVLVDAM